MHPYAVDSDERTHVVFLFAALSIILIWAVQHVLTYFAISFPWFICIPSPFAVFGLLWLFFDRYLWKFSILHSIGLIKTPDLSGEWHGDLQSSHDEYHTVHPISLKVDQNWTSICLFLHANVSSSQSEVASIYINDSTGPVINYLYLNDPNPKTPKTMHIHRGTTTLRYDASKDTLEGSYYTDGKRKNYGEIRLERGK
jgi:hypothetical protein